MPDDLARKFRAAHQAIVATIDQVQPFIRSYHQAKPLVRELNLKLLAHFSRENAGFFSLLREVCLDDRPALKMIEFLELDTKDMKIKVLTFAEEHSGEMEDIRSRNFPRNFTEFSSAVIGRIRLEEDYLFPLLAKLE